jgi:hypothetical protein
MMRTTSRITVTSVLLVANTVKNCVIFLDLALATRAR